MEILLSWLFAGYDISRSYYAEVQWSYLKDAESTFGFFLGFTPKAGFYARKAAIVNTGFNYTRALKLGDSFTLPLKISLILNPEEKNLFITACLSF